MEYLYQLKNDKNEIIYVGKTKNLRQRLLQHAKYKSWFNEVSEIYYHLFENKTDCDVYEIYYINKFNPIYNRDTRNEQMFSQKLLEVEFKQLSVAQFIFMGQTVKHSKRLSTPIIHLTSFSLFDNEILREYKKSQFEFNGNIIKIEFTEKHTDLYNYLVLVEKGMFGQALSKDEQDKIFNDHLSLYINNERFMYPSWRILETNGCINIGLNNVLKKYLGKGEF